MMALDLNTEYLQHAPPLHYAQAEKYLAVQAGIRAMYKKHFIDPLAELESILFEDGDNAQVYQAKEYRTERLNGFTLRESNQLKKASLIYNAQGLDTDILLLTILPEFINVGTDGPGSTRWYFGSTPPERRDAFIASRIKPLPAAVSINYAGLPFVYDQGDDVDNPDGLSPRLQVCAATRRFGFDRGAGNLPRPGGFEGMVLDNTEGNVVTVIPTTGGTDYKSVDIYVRVPTSWFDRGDPVQNRIFLVPHGELWPIALGNMEVIGNRDGYQTLLAHRLVDIDAATTFTIERDPLI